MALTAGTSLQDGKYIIQTVVRQSTVGVTYAVLHSTTDQLVTVQALSDELRQQPDVATLQQQFLASVDDLVDSETVQVLDCFQEDGNSFVVLRSRTDGAVSDMEAWFLAADREPDPLYRQVVDQGVVNPAAETAALSFESSIAAPETLVIRSLTSDAAIVDTPIVDAPVDAPSEGERDRSLSERGEVEIKDAVRQVRQETSELTGQVENSLPVGRNQAIAPDPVDALADRLAAMEPAEMDRAEAGHFEMDHFEDSAEADYAEIESDEIAATAHPAAAPLSPKIANYIVSLPNLAERRSDRWFPLALSGTAVIAGLIGTGFVLNVRLAPEIASRQSADSHAVGTSLPFSRDQSFPDKGDWPITDTAELFPEEEAAPVIQNPVFYSTTSPTVDENGIPQFQQPQPTTLPPEGQYAAPEYRPEQQAPIDEPAAPLPRYVPEPPRPAAPQPQRAIAEPPSVAPAAPAPLAEPTPAPAAPIPPATDLPEPAAPLPDILTPAPDPAPPPTSRARSEGSGDRLN
jgi:hypothetical protein